MKCYRLCSWLVKCHKRTRVSKYREGNWPCGVGAARAWGTCQSPGCQECWASEFPPLPSPPIPFPLPSLLPLPSTSLPSPPLPWQECSSSLSRAAQHDISSNDFTKHSQQLPVYLLPLPEHLHLLPVKIISLCNYVGLSWVMKVKSNF